MRLIFLGPLLMAFGGVLSLSDRRLRFGVPRRAVGAQPSPGARGMSPAARSSPALAALLCLGRRRRSGRPAEESQPRRPARAALFREIRCVVCQSESIDDSDADLARDLRQRVRQEVAAGDGPTPRSRPTWCAATASSSCCGRAFRSATPCCGSAPSPSCWQGVGVLLPRGDRSRPPTASSERADEEARLDGVDRQLSGLSRLRHSCVPKAPYIGRKPC